MDYKDRMKLIINNKYNRVVFIVFLLFFSYIYSYHTSWRRPSFLIGSYWFDHWLLNYTFGFVRRGLLGSALNFLGGLQHNVLFINLSAVVITLSVVILFIRQLVDFFAVDSLIGLLFIFAFIFSPMISVFFECCGDPLQLTLLITFLLVHLITKYNMTIFRKLVLFTVLMAINMLIHEASLFICGVLFILILFDKKSDRVFFKNLGLKMMATLCYGVALLSLAYLIMWKGTINEQKNEGLVKGMFSQSQFIKADYHTAKDSLILKPIKEEMKCSEFYQASFEKSAIPIVKKFLGVIVAPLLLCNLFLSAACIQRKETYMRFYKYLLYFALFSFPLYIVAWDWGRFSMYTLCLIMYSFCKMRGPDTRTLVNSLDESCAVRFLVINEKEEKTVSYMVARKVLFLTLLILITCPLNSTTYRTSGLSYHSLIVFLFVGLPLLFWVNLTNRQ